MSENNKGKERLTRCGDCAHFDPFLCSDGHKYDGLCWSRRKDGPDYPDKVRKDDSCIYGTEMNVIVTGAGGFIGEYMVKELAGRGYDVYALCHGIKNAVPNVTYIDVSGMDPGGIKRALEGRAYGCFYDFAWSGTSGKDRADCEKQIENIRMTCDYVRLAADLGCRTFLYASSINEMETYEYLQSDNVRPSGGYIYGSAKLAAHLMAETEAYRLGISFIPVIITNIYGAEEDSERLVCSSVKKMIRGERASFTKGDQSYDFIYVSDAVNSIIAVGENGVPFNRYYIGSGNVRPLRDYILEMRQAAAPGAELGLGDYPFNGKSISYEQFDMKKVERDTGYKNKVAFTDGIRMTAENIRKREKNEKV